MLWIIPWPSNGTIAIFIDNVIKYICKLLQNCEVHIIFDRYYEHSIKQSTRQSRAGTISGRQHSLTLNTLNTPLPTQKMLLTVTDNKVQLIALIMGCIKDNAHSLVHVASKLVLTGPDTFSMEINKGIAIKRLDLATQHEEADVIIAQRVVNLASN